MIYSEIYGRYFLTVSKILKEAVTHPLSEKEIQKIIQENAYSESNISITEALKTHRWPLLKKNGDSVIRNLRPIPLTTLQKQWIKAILNDPRIRLFGTWDDPFPGIKPLFTEDDYLIFDRYLDGDPYEDEQYVRTFQMILNAVREKTPLEIEIRTRNGRTLKRIVTPSYLEYSEKDDKFRLICSGSRMQNTINLARIIRCSVVSHEKVSKEITDTITHPRRVVFQLIDEHNALERVLLHFAHFKKQVERLDEKQYRITVYYDLDDETEMVIRILSFGPRIKVTEPSYFVELIKQRLIEQKNCGL